MKKHPFASRINTLPAKLGGKTAQEVQEIFPPKPFGCEFTFILPGREDKTTLPEFPKSLKEYLRFHAPDWVDDFGALEIRSPVFVRYADCIDYWSRLRADLRRWKFIPWFWDAPNGGLHIRINLSERDLPRAGRVMVFGHFAQWDLHHLAEVGCTESELKASDGHLLFSKEFNLTDRQLFLMFSDGLDVTGVPGLRLDERSSGRPPTIEHRYFDSPASPSELLRSLYIAQRVQHLGLSARIYDTGLHIKWSAIMGPIDEPRPFDRIAAHWEDSWEKVTGKEKPYITDL